MAQDAATCLASYDLSRYPEDSGATFTAFFYQQACGAGMRLVGDIKVGRRSVLEYILNPITRVLDESLREP